MQIQKILYRLFLICFIAVQSCSDSTITESPFDLFNDSTAVLTYALDETVLDELTARLTEGEYGEIHSLIIIHNDTLAFEKYFRGWERQDLHYCYSVTKSFTSALIGIALDKGLINNLDEKLLSFFPEYTSFQNLNSRKQNINLGNLLSMQAGFKWDEWSTKYGTPQNDATRLYGSNDWMKYMLDLPVINEPGTSFTYNSGVTMLLSGIIKNKTGMTTEIFAAQNLFGKININNWNWEKGPNDITNTGWGLHLRPIDLANFGNLYLKKGRHNGDQVVSEEWINISTSKKVDRPQRSDYAYHWWKYSPEGLTAQRLKVNDVYYALGYGGQYIWVIPHMNMVVVSTAGNFEGNFSSHVFFRDYIIGAVKNY